MIPLSLQKELIYGELADHALYVSLRSRATGELQTVLDEFIATEKRHIAFWQERFDLHIDEPSLLGRLRNSVIRGAVWLSAGKLTYILLEAVETHGIRKYLDLWKHVEDSELREGLRVILTEELLHEDVAITQGNRTVRPEVIRNAFLGFNDGSVEILGAVNGLVAALHDPKLVSVSAITVSIAGAISMAAGAFLSVHSEREVEHIEALKKSFLSGDIVDADVREEGSAFGAARLVGGAYVIGAAVPVIPFLYGATSPIYSIVLSGGLILVVAAVLSFLSGMSMARRIALNVGVIVVAVFVSYALGWAAKQFFGISV